MPIMVKEGEKRIIYIAPAGNTQAVCFDVWDLGYQESDFKGEKKIQHKIKIGFELNKRIQSSDQMNGKRYRIYRDYTASLDKKANLRKDLTAWRGREFTPEELGALDVEKLIGENCLLNIIHYEGRDKEPRAKFNAISGLIDGMPKITPEQGREIPEWVEAIQAKAVMPESTEEVGTEVS